MATLPMIYGSTPDSVARADYARAQMMQQNLESGLAGAHRAAAAMQARKQQAWQNQFVQEARALQQTENERRNEMAERQWRSTIFDREQDRLTRERIAGMQAADSAQDRAARERIAQAQITDNAEYRKNLKQMDIDARTEAAKIANQNRIEAEKLEQRNREAALKYKQEEDQRQFNIAQELDQVQSIERNWRSGATQYSTDQFFGLADQMTSPIAKAKMRAMGEQQRQYEEMDYKSAVELAGMMDNKVAALRDKFEGMGDAWFPTKSRTRNARIAMESAAASALSSLPKEQRGLVTWDKDLRQFVPAVPDPTKRPLPGAGRPVVPTGQPAAAPTSATQMLPPTGAAQPAPRQSLPLQFPQYDINEPVSTNVVSSPGGGYIAPGDMLAPGPAVTSGRSGESADMYYLPMGGEQQVFPMVEPGYPSEPEPYGIMPAPMQSLEEAATQPYGIAPAPMIYPEESGAEPYGIMEAPAMIPEAQPQSGPSGVASSGWIPEEAAMIPPARPTETPEQIVARGGRPIDFSVNFPAGVAPSGSASVSSGPGGSMFFGGEEVPFTPSDLREYYNKLTDLRMMRAPDGSPLHSNEEAQLIAADWVFQQKAGTLLGR